MKERIVRQHTKSEQTGRSCGRGNAALKRMSYAMLGGQVAIQIGLSVDCQHSQNYRVPTCLLVLPIVSRDTEPMTPPGIWSLELRALLYKPVRILHESLHEARHVSFRMTRWVSIQRFI